MVVQIKMETSQAATTAATKAKTKNKKQPRMRPLPPAVNARNLAIEKRRRQDMNVVFLDLARCLPTLTCVERLSKRLIVMETLQHVRQQRDICITAGRELRGLLAAHNNLIAEVNTLRSQLGIPVENVQRPPSAAFLSIMAVENQTYGEFPHGFAHPSDSENNKPQPSARQSEGPTPLPGLPVAPDLVSSAHTSAQDCLTNHLNNGTPDVVSPVDWQGSTPDPFFLSSNVQDVLAPDTDWWGLNAAGLNAEVSWEDLPAHIMPWGEHV